MKRTLEPELMDDPEQARAYAKADFEEENQGFVELFRRSYPGMTEGHVLDLGWRIFRSALPGRSQPAL